MGEIIPFPDLLGGDNAAAERGSRLSVEKECRGTSDATCAGDGDEDQDLERRKFALARFDEIRQLIEAGRIEDFLIVGFHAGNKHFLTDIDFCPNERADLFAFVGVLDALKLELTELAQLSPALLPDGRVLDPFEDMFT